MNLLEQVANELVERLKELNLEDPQVVSLTLEVYGGNLDKEVWNLPAISVDILPLKNNDFSIEQYMSQRIKHKDGKRTVLQKRTMEHPESFDYKTFFKSKNK